MWIRLFILIFYRTGIDCLGLLRDGKESRLARCLKTAYLQQKSAKTGANSVFLRLGFNHKKTAETHVFIEFQAVFSFDTALHKLPLSRRRTSGLFFRQPCVYARYIYCFVGLRCFILCGVGFKTSGQPIAKPNHAWRGWCRCRGGAAAGIRRYQRLFLLPEYSIAVHRKI